jgi:hypothetical protein
LGKSRHGSWQCHPVMTKLTMWPKSLPKNSLARFLHIYLYINTMFHVEQLITNKLNIMKKSVVNKCEDCMFFGYLLNNGERKDTTHCYFYGHKVYEIVYPNRKCLNFKPYNKPY